MCDTSKKDKGIIVSIHDLPTELFFYILSLLTPYNNFKNCKLVCKRWYLAVRELEKKLENDFIIALQTGHLQWKLLCHALPYSTTTISKRFCHCSTVLGFTSANTTFNDLWKLDLTTRQWTRPLAMGTYPSPKASATLIPYKNKLLLFGGISYRYMSGSSTQNLHTYNVDLNMWELLQENSVLAPCLAGHSVSLIKNQMIIFGGCQLQNELGSRFLENSNNVWALDLDNMVWKLCVTTEPKPLPRYAHTQVKINEESILIIGGHGGPNAIFNDVWLLELNYQPWKWSELTVVCSHWAVQHIWQHPGCKVGNMIVFLGKLSSHRNPQAAGLVSWPIIRSTRPIIWSPHINENYKNGTVHRREQGHFRASRILSRNINSSWPSIRPNANKNRALQLEGLYRAEQRLRDMHKNNVPQLVSSMHSSMTVHILDISEALTKKVVRWPTTYNQHDLAPEETSFYSLVAGNAELIMFGGLKKTVNEEETDALVNTVYFLQAPHLIP